MTYIDKVAQRIMSVAGCDYIDQPAHSSTLVLHPSGLRIGVRVATQSTRLHEITHGKRHYSYSYKVWHFNCHVHGRRVTDIDVWVFVQVHAPRKATYWIVPASAVTGLTWSQHCGRREYAGRYAKYREAWDVLAPKRRRRAA